MKAKLEKLQIKGFVLGMLMMFILSGATVYAAVRTETITVTFRNIRIVIDGTTIIPTDAGGNVVEPFIYQGTTFLPARAIANALNHDVRWDANSSVIYLYSRTPIPASTPVPTPVPTPTPTPQPTPAPDLDPFPIVFTELLDDFGQPSFRSGRADWRFARVVGAVTDIHGNRFYDGIVIHSPSTPTVVSNDPHGAHAVAEYSLNREHQEITGRVIVPQQINITGITQNNLPITGNSVTVLFVGDGSLLHSVTGVTAETPTDFVVDVRNVNRLEIKIMTNNVHGTLLTNVRMYI